MLALSASFIHSVTLISCPELYVQVPRCPKILVLSLPALKKGRPLIIARSYTYFVVYTPKASFFPSSPISNSLSFLFLTPPNGSIWEVPREFQDPQLPNRHFSHEILLILTTIARSYDYYYYDYYSLSVSCIFSPLLLVSPLPIS